MFTNLGMENGERRIIAHVSFLVVNCTRTLFLDFSRKKREKGGSVSHGYLVEREISFEIEIEWRKFSPFQLLRVLDLVPDGAGQAVRGLLPAPVDPPVLEIELVLRYILRAAVVAPSVLQYRFATSLIRVMLRARAYAPMMIERRIIHAEYLIANGDAPLGQFLARPVRPSAHVRVHISPPFLPPDNRGGGWIRPSQDRVFTRRFDVRAPLRFHRGREKNRFYRNSIPTTGSSRA